MQRTPQDRSSGAPRAIICEGHVLHRNCASQGIFRLYHPECTADDGALLQPCGISLQAWIAIFGVVQLIISQLPDISSLRELNLFCTACTVMFAIGCLGMSIYNGEKLVVTFPFQALGVECPCRYVASCFRKVRWLCGIQSTILHGMVQETARLIARRLTLQ